jgi:hypothetical protein
MLIQQQQQQQHQHQQQQQHQHQHQQQRAMDYNAMTQEWVPRQPYQ